MSKIKPLEWEAPDGAYVTFSRSAAGLDVEASHGSDSVALTLPPAPVAALATLCLYGRISWEMVDALRGAMQETPLASQAEALEPLADLLESLLPPRAE